MSISWSYVSTRHRLLPVSVKNDTPSEKKRRGKTGFQSTKAGAGEQFLLLDCRATARAEGVVFSQPWLEARRSAL